MRRSVPVEACYPLLWMKAAEDHLWIDADGKAADICIRCGWSKTDVRARAYLGEQP